MYIVQFTRTSHTIVMNDTLALMVAGSHLSAMRYRDIVFYSNEPFDLFTKRDIALFRSELSASRYIAKPQAWFDRLAIGIAPRDVELIEERELLAVPRDDE